MKVRGGNEKAIGPKGVLGPPSRNAVAPALLAGYQPACYITNIVFTFLRIQVGKNLLQNLKLWV